MPTSARFVHSAAQILFAVAVSIVAAMAFAQELPIESSLQRPGVTSNTLLSSGESPAEWPNLSGDWFGSRAVIASRGLTLDFSTTQFYQGATHGGLEQEFQYGGRNDYLMNLDGEKAGLWNGASFMLHGETRYGESGNSLTGALSPVNLMLSVPLSTGTVTGLTGVKFTQVLSEELLVYAGKINTLDDFKQPLTGAGPLNGFQNSAMIYNPVFARTIPYSTIGAGFAYLKNTERVFEVAVYDTNNSPTVSGFNTLFNNGATAYAQGTVPTTLFEKPGHQGISGTYSSGTYSDLTPTAYLDPVVGVVFLSTPVQGSWCLTYNVDQAVYVSPDDPQRMWGVFGNLGIADKNPSPVRWFANTGISGTSSIPGRKADTFGIAYFYIGVSDSLKTRATNLVSLGDEYGAELYYNVAVTSWCQITPDLQVIAPFRNRAETSVLVGLRAKIDF
ncbi:carbohydrate porin [Schlesneria paludicola]|uniref:carbohydrate porin n=1 Tax=Schlesneria paludicola TaxID=360056 RepID=UPI00029A793F|nr:carbohydrate porin [Schlesneria paludicola]